MKEAAPAGHARLRPVAPLTTLCEAIVDCPHSTPTWTGTGAVVLRSQNIRNGRLEFAQTSYTDEAHFVKRTRRAAPKEGDLVITREAPMGEVCMIPAGLRCCLGQRMVLLRPDRSKAVPQFLLYALQSKQVQDEIRISEGTGSTVSNLRIPLLEALPIPTPTLPEQHAIAGILGALDDKIELNRRMNSTLEAIARALFKSWFVDFEPVRAKMRGEKPTGIDAKTAALFPERLVETEIGEVPEGWSVRPIGDVVEVKGGSTPSTDNPAFWAGGIHAWATPRDMSKLQAPVLLETERSISDEGLAAISSGLLPTGTVLLSSRAPIGYLAIAQMPTAVNQGFIAMVCDGPVSNNYVVNWVRESMGAIEGRASGTTFQEISKSNFRPIPVAIPSEPVMAAFDAVVSPIYGRLTTNERDSRMLAQARDTLLPELLSGELLVPFEQEVPV